MKRLYFLLVALGLAIAGNAQTAYQAVVKNRATNKPIEGVVVKVSQASFIRDTTDHDGIVLFEGIRSRPITLRFSCPGYKDLDVPAQFPDPQSHEIFLEELSEPAPRYVRN